MIILAGGLGTRLSDTVPGLQKCMAPVNGRPFLYYVIKYLVRHQLNHFIFSLGYRHENISSFVGSHFPKLNSSYSIEESPLGTGGAILKALSAVKNEHVLVLNGDTFFNVHLPALLELHKKKDADCTIALKPMKHFDRYGSVKLNEENMVTAFTEKQFYDEGLINGGIYLIRKQTLLDENLPGKFSFEKEFLAKFVTDKKIFGQVHDDYFIDIGIPADYYRAQDELKQFV